MAANNNYRARSIAFKSIMKDKVLSKYVLDTFDAPAGSTKNKIAAKLLRSAEKSLRGQMGMNDGQGGLASLPTPLPDPNAQGIRQPGLQNSGLPISIGPTGQAQGTAPGGLNLAPTGDPREQLNVTAPPQPTVIARGIDNLLPGLKSGGAKIPLDLSQKKPSGLFTTTPGVTSAVPRQGQFGMTGGQTQFGPVYGTQPMVSEKPKVGPVTQKSLIEQRTGQKFTQGEADIAFKTCMMTGGNLNSCVLKAKEQTGFLPGFSTMSYSAKQKALAAAAKPPKAAPTGTAGAETQTGTGEAAGVTGAPAGAPSGAPAHDDTDSLASSYGPSDVWAMVEKALTSGNGEDIEAWFTALQKTNPTLASQWAPIYNAVRTGAGSGSVLLSIISNPDELSATLGIPKEVLDKMPFDIIGGPKLSQLKDVAKKQFDLDALESELFKRQTTHLYADQNFRSYIRGKDQILGKVDRMIDEYSVQMEGMDLSNPWIRDRVKTYSNYLTNIKGSTEKRYMDLLQDSISLESADYERFNTIYQSKVNEANQLYNSLVSQASSSQQTLLPMVQGAITGMYDSLEKRKNGNVEGLKMQMDLIKSATEVANLMALAPFKVQEAQIGYDTKTVQLDIEKEKLKQEQAQTLGKDLTKLKPLNLQAIEREIYEEKTYTNEQGQKVTTTNLKSINPYLLYDIAAKTSSNPLSVIDVYGPALAKQISSSIASGSSPEKVIAPFLATVREDTSGLSLDSVAALTPEQKTQIADSYVNAVSSGVAQGVRGLLLGNSEGALKIVKSLRGVGKLKSSEKTSELYKMIMNGQRDYVASEAKAGAFANDFPDGNVPPFGWTDEEFQTLLESGSDAVIDQVAAMVAHATTGKL